MSMQPNRNGKGFTVVEVLVAAAILLVALLAILDVFPTSSTNVDEGGRISSAVALAQQTIEVIKSTTTFPPTAGNCASVYGVSVPAYTCNVSVPAPTGSSPNRLATITVTTTWRNSKRSGNVSLVTRIAE